MVALFRVEEIPWTSRRNRQAARFAAQAQEVPGLQQKGTWCRKSYKLGIRVRRGLAVTLAMDFTSNPTLTGCAPIRGLGTVCSKQLLDDYDQDETGTAKLCL